MIGLFCVWICSSEAAAVADLDVAELASASNAIVIGSVISVRQNGRRDIKVGNQLIGAGRLKVELVVQRVVKGDVTSGGLSFEFAWPDLPIAYQRIAVGDSGMFFLRGEPGNYYLSDPHYAYIAASSRCQYIESETNPVDRIATELRCALEESGATEHTQMSSIGALESIRTVLATEALRLAASTTTGRVRLHAVAALLRRDDISQLESVEDVLLQPVPESLKSSVDDVAGGIFTGVRSPKAIPILQQLVRAPDSKVRRGAAQALRNTGSTNAIRGLAEALDDSQRDIRYIGVIGLAEITHQDEWAPAVDNFTQHEAKFLSYWRKWAVENTQ